MVVPCLLALALAQAPLSPPTLETGVLGGFSGAAFGNSIDIDGNRALISAPVTFDGTSLSGAVYTYLWNGNGWDYEQRLDAPGFIEYQDFGRQIGLSGDIAVVGVRYMDTVAGNNSGGAVVFERAGTSWTQTAELIPPAGSDSALYGIGIEIEGDLAVMSGDSLTAPYLVYRRQPDASWALVQEITLPGVFQGDLALSTPRIQDEVLYLPAPYASGPGSFSGAIYVFEPRPTGWMFKQAIRAEPGLANTYLGRDFDVSGDTLVASSPFIEVPGQPLGGVLVFERINDVWEQVELLPNPLSGALAVTLFGDAVALSGDRLLVGAPGSSGEYQGTPAYAARFASYERIGGSFELRGVLLDPAGAPPPYMPGGDAYGNYFGATVALQGDRGIVGAPYDNLLFEDAGQAYTFDVGQLAVNTTELSLAAGGVQELTLQAGLPFANQVHFVLGSLSGTAPGLALEGLLLPLNPDAYLTQTATQPDATPIAGAIGSLDAFGRAQASVTLPPNFLPALAGTTAHHAFLIIDPNLPAIVATSEAEPLLLLP